VGHYGARRAVGAAVTVGEFAERIAFVGILTGFSVTSWGRSLKHNQAVGGVEDSFHPLWLAVDGNLDDRADLPRLKAWCTRCGLTVINEGDHLHVQPST
jgi:hypothetical protein